MIGHRYKYYLTIFGRRVLTTALAIREYVAVSRLQNAVQLLRLARATAEADPRRALIDSATAEITAARGLMVG